MLSNFIFDQTEYVYTFLSRTSQSNISGAIEQLPGAYRACLESYETITEFLKEQGDSSPCTLFAQYVTNELACSPNLLSNFVPFL
jgi:hypothetical protein